MIEIVGKTKRLNTFKLKYCNIVKILINFASQRTFSHHNQFRLHFLSFADWCGSKYFVVSQSSIFPLLFNCVVPDPVPNSTCGIRSGPTKLLKTDFISIRIHNTMVLLIVFLSCIFSLLISYCPSL